MEQQPPLALSTDTPLPSLVAGHTFVQESATDVFLAGADPKYRHSDADATLPATVVVESFEVPNSHRSSLEPRKSVESIYGLLEKNLTDATSVLQLRNNGTHCNTYLRQPSACSPSRMPSTSPIDRAIVFTRSPTSPGARAPQRSTPDGESGIAHTAQYHIGRRDELALASLAGAPRHASGLRRRSKSASISQRARCRLDNVSDQNASRQRAPSETQHDNYLERVSAPKAHVHFRPVRYEVTTELDKFFGTSRKQRRELALHAHDENGAIWFDDIGEQGHRQSAEMPGNGQN